MYWINVAQLLNRHLRRLHKLAHQLTSGLFLMCLLVFSQHSYGFEAGSSSFSGGGSSAGSPGGGGRAGGGYSGGGGSYSSSFRSGDRGSGSGSGYIEEIIVTATRPSPSSGVTWISGAGLDGWIFSSLASNIVAPGSGSYGSSSNSATQKNNPNFKQNCWRSLTGKPDARISSGFGYRKDPITGARRLHNGFDIAVGTGTPLYAARAGRVNRVHKGIPVGKHGGVDNGNYVRINYHDGTQGVYLHMKDVRAAKDQFVSAGQFIGTSNDTGRSDGAHLHYTIYDGQGRSKKALDPTKAHSQCQSGKQSGAYMGGFGHFGL